MDEEVWTQGPDGEGWHFAKVLSKDEFETTVEVQGSKFKVKSENVLPRNREDLDGVSELGKLEFLHEPAVLHNLKTRFVNREPYTSAVGMCIAVNPYRVYEELYSEENQVKYFRHFCDQSSTESRGNENLQPHVYRIASQAFVDLNRTGKSQSILISGESGAGKTESTKYTLQYLAKGSSLQEALLVDRSSLHGADNTKTIQSILASGPLLEAFGNAKTVRNDNSSRFGKFVCLQFKRYNQSSSALNTISTLCGGHLETYLLEKSRVVHQSDGERNFHVFYQLVHGGLDHEFSTKAFHDNAHFQVLSSNSQPEIDLNVGKRTRDSLDAMGLADRVQDICQVLATILFLGELEPVLTDPSNEESGCILDQGETSRTALGEVMKYLAVEEKNEIEKAICERTISVGGEIFSRKLSPKDAHANAQALMKALYAWLFDWIVLKINVAISSQKSAQEARLELATISVLDIFGFECFQLNCLEQLCINLTNERLQQVFNDTVLLQTQIEYEEEGIPWTRVDYSDGQYIIDRIQGRGGSVFALLDEESFRPKGEASAFVSKLLGAQDSRGGLGKDRFDKLNFSIQHYACEVMYSAHKFLEKNTDTLHSDMSAFLLCKCKYKFLEEFVDHGTTTEQSARRSMTSQTLTRKFKKQLDDLISTINSTKPHFIRCIKPNEKQCWETFSDTQVLQQLRCSGVIEAIRISRAGFPDRISHIDLVRRFGPSVNVWSSSSDSETGQRTKAEAVLLHWFPGESTLVEKCLVGKTKTFFAGGAMDQLSLLHGRLLTECSIKIQRNCRTFLAHLLLKRMRATLLLQSTTRAWIYRTRFIRFQQAAKVIQKTIRGAQDRTTFRRKRHAAVTVQSVVRARFARQEVRNRRREVAAEKIQKTWRGVLPRKRFSLVLFAIIRVQSLVRKMVRRRKASMEGMKRTIQEMQETIDKLELQLAQNDVPVAAGTQMENEALLQKVLELEKENALLRKERQCTLAVKEGVPSAPAVEEFSRRDVKAKVLQDEVDQGSSAPTAVEEFSRENVDDNETNHIQLLELQNEKLVKDNAKLKRFAKVLHEKYLDLQKQVSDMGKFTQDKVIQNESPAQATVDENNPGVSNQQMKGQHRTQKIDAMSFASRSPHSNFESITGTERGKPSQKRAVLKAHSASTVLENPRRKPRGGSQNSMEEYEDDEAKAYAVLTGGYTVFRDMVVNSSESIVNTFRTVGNFLLEEIDPLDLNMDIESDSNRRSLPVRYQQSERELGKKHKKGLKLRPHSDLQAVVPQAEASTLTSPQVRTTASPRTPIGAKKDPRKRRPAHSLGAVRVVEHHST